MNINSIGHAGYGAYPAAAVKKDEAAAVEQENTAVSVSVRNQDTYVPSVPSAEEAGAQEAAAKGPAKLSKEQVAALKQQVYDSMRSLAEKLLGIQVGKGTDMAALAESLGMGTTPETAAAAISEDGMWGVNAVATRLMDMAMALSGGDVSKAEMLREAVQEGFAQVGALEDLPQVCQDTYAETMARFDYWVENGSLEGYGQANAGKKAEATA